MTADKAAMAFGAFGRHVYGLGVLAIGLTSLAFREFDPGQPVPAGFPARSALIYIAGVLIVLAAAAVQWRRTAPWGAAVLAAYYAFIVVFLMDGRLFLTGYAHLGTYENIAEQLSVAAAGLIVYATTAQIDASLCARLARLGRIVFSLCLLVFGSAHFVYMNMTAPLVPKWLPPSQVFWGYVTGLGFLAAGIAILIKVRGRLAAILLTVMFASFALVVHTPILLADHSSHWNWSESGINLAITGAAWVVADSLMPRGRRLV